MPRSAFLMLAGCALAAALASAPVLAAPSAPPQFVVENLFPGVTFNTPTDIAWLPDGRALVTEKRGYVWMVANGVKSAQPVLDIRADVLDQNDRGLISIARDPAFFVNHYIYVLYVVDPDSNNIETNANAFSRLSRYTINFTDSSTVIPSSRRILFGRTWTEGPVSCADSHTGDDLEWGSDGSLLVSIGDGASYTATDAGGLHAAAFTAGRTDPYEDIGAFRAQSLSSLTGKVLRLNPATGFGYASNPFADGNLASKRSRVWAYGLRNPFRIRVRPGTGAADTSAGNPGVVYVGDVGWTLVEEQDIATAPGRNFGWPCFEGNLSNGAYQSASPAHNGCGSVGSADNPSPFTAPMIYYGRTSGTSNFGLIGNTAIGGTFYTGTRYPTAYRGYVFGDYGSNWIAVGALNGSGVVNSVTSFVTSADGPVSFNTDPQTGDIVYVAIVTGEVRRIRYTGATGNQDPVVNAAAAPASGPAPLSVSFSSAGTFDPDGDAMGYSWNFGDGQGSSLANPQHVYAGPGAFSAVLTVTDVRGGQGRDTVVVVATGPSSFPTTTVLDDFNRANGSPVDAAHPWVRTGGQAVINASQLSLPSAGDLIWSPVFGATQEVHARAANGSWPSQFLLFLKNQGTTPSAAHLALFYDPAGAGRVALESYDPARVPNYIEHGALTLALAAGDRLGARALANGAVEVYRNGARVGTIDASSFAYASASGRIGMGWWGSNTTSFRADDFGGGDVSTTSNTPPSVQITSPLANTRFIDQQTITLACNAADAQDAASALQYHWDVELHHNTHVHFAYSFDSPTASFPAENHDDGTGVFMRLRVRVTDSGGLTATDSLDLYPEMDLSPSAIRVTPASPTSADSVTISFQVRNLGRMPAPISRWRLVEGPVLLAEGDVVVAALDSQFVSVRRGPFAAGTYTLRARADSLGAVAETDESNNASVASLVVTPAPGPPPTGFPTTSVLDDFGRPNGSPIDATHPWLRSGALAIIDASALSIPGAGDALWDAAFGPTQEVFVRAPNASWPSQFLLHMKCQGTNPASAHVSVFYDAAAAGDKLVVESYDPATGYVTHGALNATLAAGDVLGARARSDGQMEVYRNGALVGAVNYASWPFAASGGRIGVGWWGANASAFRADDFGGGTTVAGNTRPSVAITSPAANSPFISGQSLALTCSASDAQQPANTLTYLWTSEIRRGSGVSAGPSYTTASASLPAQNWDDGSGVLLRIQVRVTDSGGLSGSAQVDVFPETDLSVSAIAVTPASPLSNDSLTLAFRVRNTGRMPAHASRWRLVTGSTLLAEGDVAVPPLDSVAISVRRGPLTAGTYTLRARADSLGAVVETNEANNAGMATLVVTPAPGANRAPVAVASGTPTSGTSPLTVAFSSAGSSDPDGDPLAFAWTFGDGGTATTASPSRTYTTAGSYTAILTVSDGRGGTDTASVAIQVNAAPAGFPTTARLDDFDRANGSPIDAAHPWVRSGGLATISTNQLSLPSAGDLVWNQTLGASQEVYAKAVNTSWPNQFLLYLKCQGTTPAASHVSVLYSSGGPAGGRVEVESYDPGRSPRFVTHGTLSVALTAGDVLGARARADGQMEVYRNGALLGTVGFTTWSGATLGGRIGIGWWGSNTTSFRADDFGGGTTVAASQAFAYQQPASQPSPGEIVLPRALALSAAFPNPTAGGVSFTLELPRAEDVEFTIFDLQGRAVWRAPGRAAPAGRFTLAWSGASTDGTPVGAGVYLARVAVGGKSFTRRLVRVK